MFICETITLREVNVVVPSRCYKANVFIDIKMAGFVEGLFAVETIISERLSFF